MTSLSPPRSLTGKKNHAGVPSPTSEVKKSGSGGKCVSPRYRVDDSADAWYASALLEENVVRDYAQISRECRRATVPASGIHLDHPAGWVVLSFPVEPTTGDVVVSYELLCSPKCPPRTSEEVEALVAAGYGRKDDKRLMMTLSPKAGSTRTPFAGAGVPSAEILLPWTEWSSSKADGLCRFIPPDSSGQPIWMPVHGLLDAGARLHLQVSALLPPLCDLFLVVRTALSDSLRHAATTPKKWKIAGGNTLFYDPSQPVGQRLATA